MSLPPSFLPQYPPGDVSIRKIDFTTTTPPIPEYKDRIALVIDNFLTPSECQTLLQAAQESTTTTTESNTPWSKAIIDKGGEIDRNCGRIAYDTPLIAQKLFSRLLPFLSEVGIGTIFNNDHIIDDEYFSPQDVFRVSRLNPSLRFLRYERLEFFKPHWDATYQSPGDENEITIFTIHLYLNGDGEQDLEELERGRLLSSPPDDNGDEGGDEQLPLLGGATSLSGDLRLRLTKSFVSFRRLGRCLFFSRRICCMLAMMFIGE